MSKIEQPLNANERYLYAIAIRMDAMCNMMSSFMELYAKQSGVAVTSNKVEDKVETVIAEEVPKEEVVKPKRTRKNIEK